MPKPPPMPYNPVGAVPRAGAEFGELAGAGDAVALPAELQQAGDTAREAIVAGLSHADQTFTIEGFGTFKRSVVPADPSLVLVTFRADPAAQAAVQSGEAYEPEGLHAELARFIVSQSSTRAVFVEGVGWFGQKTMPGFKNATIDVPPRTTLYLRPAPELQEAIVARR